MLQSDLPGKPQDALPPSPPGKAANFPNLVAFWICYAIVTTLAGTIYLHITPSPDQSIFDYMAWLDLHGVPFYKGSFDMTWPGQLVFHELGVWAFGVHPWTARAMDFVLLQPAVLAIFIYVHRCGFPRSAVAAGLLYPIIYATSGEWMTGLRDLTGAHVLIGAAIFALPTLKRSPWAPIFAGTLCGYATMIRPTYLAFAPMLFFLALPSWAGAQVRIASGVKEAGLFVTGLMIAPLLFILYALGTNTIQDWYVDSIRFIFDVYFAPQPISHVLGRLSTVLLHDLWWLTIVAILGSASWLLSGRSRQGFFLLVAMTATFVLSYFVQNKAFVYHVAGVIPVMLILACVGADLGLTYPRRPVPLREAVAGVCALLLLAGTMFRIVHARPNSQFWARQAEEPTLPPADTIAIAKIIQSESTPNDTFFQWGWQYQVSFLAQRRSPSRLINTPGAQEIRPGQHIFGAWLVQFDDELRDHPPKFILVDQTVMAPGSFRFAPTRAGTMLDILERHIGKDYFIRDHRENITLLKRRT